MNNPAKRESFLSDIVAWQNGAGLIEEITQDIKNADMNVVNHPYQGNDLTGDTIIMLDPNSDFSHKLLALHNAGESISDLLTDGDILFDNTALNRTMPQGVISVTPRWR